MNFRFNSSVIRLAQVAVWVVIPVTLFAGVEYRFRHRPAFWYQSWYEVLEARVNYHDRNDFLLVGSSRVAAALDPTTVGEVLSEQTGRPMKGCSLARGYSSLVHTYLLLRNLIDASPEKVRGAVVFLELADGLPFMAGSWRNAPDGWGGAWTYPAMRPLQLAPLIQARDYWRLWTSDTELDTTVMLTVRSLANHLKMISVREQLRHNLMRRIRQFPRRFITPRATPPKAKDVVRLAQRGGIRRDKATVSRLRNTMSEMAKRALLDQTPLRDWDRSLLPDLIDLLRRHDMRLVFFELPQARIFDEAFATPLRTADRKHFRSVAHVWGVPILSFHFPVTDDDFPDLLHMSQKRADAFSRELAEAWAEYLAGQGPDDSSQP